VRRNVTPIVAGIAAGIGVTAIAFMAGRLSVTPKVEPVNDDTRTEMFWLTYESYMTAILDKRERERRECAFTQWEADKYLGGDFKVVKCELLPGDVSLPDSRRYLVTLRFPKHFSKIEVEQKLRAVTGIADLH
jgi:hypothetical protein